MKYLLDGPEMKQYDTATMEHFGMLSAVLMERASLACMNEITNRFPNIKTSILIACGSGNNGGDGIALGRLLYLKGYSVHILFAGKPDSMTVETKRQFDIAIAYGVPFVENLNQDYDVIVDALFGIGLCRAISGHYAELIQTLNDKSAFKFAVDISSGISAQNGAILGIAFRADLTVTMGFAKIGQYLYPGTDYTGKLVVAEIGIDEHSRPDFKPNVRMLDKSDLSMLPIRRNDSNKGTYGKLLIVAGSQNMAGAAVFAAKAAYRMGTGLVKIVTPEENRIIIQSLIPEAVLSTYNANTDLKLFLEEQIGWADAIVLGPGLGMSESSEQITYFTLKLSDIPTVVDADALNILAKHLEWFNEISDKIIVTPHLGEMSRLIGSPIRSIKEDFISSATSFAARYHVSIVLKDSRSVISSPDGISYINTSGNNGMSTGGSGDVLSGIIGGLVAQNIPTSDAAALGSWIHGAAGDVAAKKYNKRSLIASDIIEGIIDVLDEKKDFYE